MIRTGLLAAIALAILAGPVPAPAADGDQEAVKTVVVSAYIEGVHVKGDPALMKTGFHPDFRMFTLREGTLVAVTLDEWAARIEKGARERKGPAPEIRHEFAHVDVMGNAAIARVELHRGGKHTFTDYLSLYRFPDGWKIVSKTFHSH